VSSSPSPSVVACRSCHAPIVWLRIRPGGRRMPIDAEPSPAGNVLVDFAAAAGLVLSVASVAVIKAETPDEPLYLSHFVTCPQSDAWRKRQRKGTS
jgi:hypothetical protein